MLASSSSPLYASRCTLVSSCPWKPRGGSSRSVLVMPPRPWLHNSGGVSTFCGTLCSSFAYGDVWVVTHCWIRSFGNHTLLCGLSRTARHAVSAFTHSRVACHALLDTQFRHSHTLLHSFPRWVGAPMMGCSRSTPQGVPEEACGGPFFPLLLPLLFHGFVAPAKSYERLSAVPILGTAEPWDLQCRVS